MKIQYLYVDNLLFFIPLLKFDRQSLSSRVIAILDLFVTVLIDKHLSDYYPNHSMLHNSSNTKTDSRTAMCGVLGNFKFEWGLWSF